MAIGKLLGVRVAPETLKTFQDICEHHRTTASDEVRRFIEAVVNEGKLPQTDEAMIPPDVLDARIEEKIREIRARVERLESDRLGKLAA